MKLIGLTGGIGSGKSTVAQIFESIGVPVFYSDVAGRLVLENDLYVIEKVKELLGSEVYIGSVPNRKLISSKVFSDPRMLDQLNAIVHPAVGEATKRWFSSLPEGTPYAIKEAAVLFESGSQRECDAVIMVTAPEDLRIKRVQIRDGATREAVMARMSNQWSDEKKVALSDFLIDNTGDRNLLQQVLKIHQLLSVQRQ